MIHKRYTIVFADPASGVSRELSIPLVPVLAVVLVLMTVPVLMGLGARWSARTQIAQLESQNASLRMENESFREATGELASQISSLQSAVDDIGVRARSDPEAERAIARLPARLRSRAMGGGLTPVADPGRWGGPHSRRRSWAMLFPRTPSVSCATSSP